MRVARRQVHPRLDLDDHRVGQHRPRASQAEGAACRRQAYAGVIARRATIRRGPGARRSRGGADRGEAVAEGSHAGRGLLQARAGDAPGAHRLAQRGPRRQVAVPGDLAAEAEQVGAHRHCPDGRLGDAGRLADRPHLQAVGDDEPGEAERLPQQRDGRGGHRRRKVTGEPGNPQVPRHHGHYPGGDRRPERRQVAVRHQVHTPGDHGDLHVGIQQGRAVPGKVLRAGGDAGRLQPPDGRGAVPGHQLRVTAERPGADDRVLRRGEHVDARREVHVDPGRRQVGADRAVDRLGQGDVVHRAERGVAGVRAAGRVAEPGDVAALLVDGDDHVTGRRPQRGRQRGELLRPGHVGPVHGDPGQAAVQCGQHPAGRGDARERRDQHGVGKAPQRAVFGAAHPFTAPATRPDEMRRCTMRKKATTGIVNRVEAAMVAPQSTVPFCWKYCT